MTTQLDKPGEPNAAAADKQPPRWRHFHYTLPGLSVALLLSACRPVPAAAAGLLLRIRLRREPARSATGSAWSEPGCGVSSADMIEPVPMPQGHGHSYTAQYVDGWATVVQPPGWSVEKADQLRNIILSE